ARGIVVIRLTDRIGLTADGGEPALGQLRLVANRDYEAKPQRCVTVAEDGVTLTIDAAAADLLLDAEIDAWFMDRTGRPLSPAGRLFLLGPQLPPPSVSRLLVVHLPTAEIADGVMQWPDTRSLVADRLGPTAVVVDEENLEAFRTLLAGIGVMIS
ncbi:MAG TPA: hypothetical protein VKE74_28360, partial [Gemmataceae bacterium]|nr:hypothetical protein [Gemmataceae bacterium]